MMYSLKEVASLADLMRKKGIMHCQSGELVLTLGPDPAIQGGALTIGGDDDDEATPEDFRGDASGMVPVNLRKLREEASK